MWKWKCEKCGKEYNNDVMAIDVRFGYVDKSADPQDQYASFDAESVWCPLCNRCAIEYIKTGE